MPNLPRDIRELTPAEWDAGLRLVLRDLSEVHANAQIAELRKAEAAELPSLVRAWGLFRDETMTGCVLLQLQPGRTALLWPPRLIEGEPRLGADWLLSEAYRELIKTDVRMVQTLLTTDFGADAEIIRAAGYRHLSDLLYLVCPASEFPAASLASGLDFIPSERAGEREFAALVEATYEGTLDCPAVNGLRSIDDVLKGYRATGTYRSSWWLIARYAGENVGCLIMADYPELDTCELIYMALVPAARGRGHGSVILRHALLLAAMARRQRLVLAVDAANEPALKMYAAAGMQAWDRKSVFIRVLNERNIA